MFSKIALITLLVNAISGQYIGAGYGAGNVGYGAGLGGCCGAAAAPIAQGCAPITTSGGNFIVSSSSPINPSGLYVLSENSIEGQLGVNGQIPFLGAVSLEADVPTTGNSAVAYKCGDCNIGITSENQVAPAAPSCGGLAGAGYAGPAIGAGLAGAGYAGPAIGAGLAGAGYAGPAIGAGLTGTGLGYGAAGAGIGYGAAALPGPGYGVNGAGFGYGAGYGAAYGPGYGAGLGYGLGPAGY